MRISPRLLATVFCATAIGVTHAQSGNMSANRAVGDSTSISSGIPSGMSFAFDSQREQITASGVRLTAPRANPATASPVTGTIDVTIQIKVVSGFESGTTYHCSVYAIGGVINPNTGTVNGGAENVNGFGTGSAGGEVTCSLTIPYEWTLPSSRSDESGLILAYAAAAVNPHSEVQHSTLQVDGILNLPASGTTSKFTYHVIL